MKYRTIVVDPPWQFDQSWLKSGFMVYNGDKGGDGARRKGRGAVANYDLMTLEDIGSLAVGEWAEPDGAHIYLWTTNTFMRDAFYLMDQWGFKQKTILTWIKPRIGMGRYYRNNTEHVVFGVKGSLKVLRHNVRTAFYGEQGRHSEKPAAFYDMVETMSPGPYLDVFARKQRFNWDTWGAECFTADGLPEPTR